MSTRSTWLFTLLVVLFSTVGLLAQDSASITGTVIDSSGAAVPDAQVTITNVERGIDLSSKTNGTGDYLVAGLPAGPVNVTVSARGFKQYKAEGVVLRVAQKARVDLTLQVGTASSEVTVEGQAIAQVETQSNDLAGVVSGKEVTQLQLNGRNFTQLVTLVPGVSNQTGQDEGQVGVGGNVSFSVNGGRTEYNNWELDGGDNMDNGSNTTLNVYPSLEAIAEFKVLTSNYGAQYGRNGSGTIEVETKSGTAHFHGSAYEFIRNDAFNSPAWFQKGVTPPYKKNDFGYTLGGPVFIPGVYNQNKDKTFFFWSQEWRRDRVPSSFPVTVVPSLAERAGDFSELCPGADCPVGPAEVNGAPNPNAGTAYPGNRVPFNPNDPTVQALLAMVPTPTGGGPGNTTWSAFPTLPTNWREELVRIDHNFNPKLRASFRFIHDSWAEIFPAPLWTAGGSFPTIQTNFQGPGLSAVARVNAVVSPTLLNEFVFSYTTDHITLLPIGAWQRPAGMTLGLFQNGFGGKVPGFSLTGGTFGGIAEDPGFLPNGPYNSNPTYTYRDNVTKITGKHNLQFGAYFVAAQKNELSAAGVGTNGTLGFDTGSVVSTGNAFADLLMGNIASFQQQNVQLKYYNRYKILEPYFQDDWRVTNRLTLNLGVRVSLYGTYRERFKNAWNFDPAHYVVGASQVDPATGLVIGDPYNGMVQCGAGGVPAGCMTGHLFNPAPRIGFAWDPRGNGKTAVRGGYAIFFEHTNGNEGNTESLESSPPASLIPEIRNINGYDNIVPQTTSTSPLAVVSIPNKARWPYVQQWHFDIQHEIAKSTVATISYVGSKGTRLGREFELNQVAPTPLAQDPYKAGEPIGSEDCGTTADAFGVPMDATTPSGVAVPYRTNAAGIPFGPAVNLGIAACGTDPNPFRTYVGIGSIMRRETGASSTYHALQTSLRRNVGGLQLSVSYTYSHAIDDSSSGLDTGLINAFNLNAFRASSNFDQRHIFNLGYVYDLPIFKGGNRLRDRVFGNWQWSGITTIQSGTPFSVYNGGAGSSPADNAGVANGVASGGSYADLVGDPKASIPKGPASDLGPFLFNPGAFAAPRGLTFGNSGRNLLRNPRRTNFDMSLLKHFPITESKQLEFRAEAFNVFNHREFAWLGGDGGSAASNSPFGNPSNSSGCFAGPNHSAGDATCLDTAFLRANAVHAARILQLALKFTF